MPMQQPQMMQNQSLLHHQQERNQRLLQSQTKVESIEKNGEKKVIEIINLEDSSEDEKSKIQEIIVNNNNTSAYQIPDPMMQIQFQNPYQIGSLPFNQALFQGQNLMNNTINPLYPQVNANMMHFLNNQRQQTPFMNARYPNISGALNNMNNMNINNLCALNMQLPNEYSQRFAQQQLQQKLIQTQYYQQQSQSRNNYQVPLSQQLFQTSNQINQQNLQKQQSEQKKLQKQIKESKSQQQKITKNIDSDDKIVQIDKTKVKINLRKLKEAEKDKNQSVLEVDNIDIYKKNRFTQEKKAQLWDLRKRIKKLPIESQNISRELNYNGQISHKNSKIKTMTRTAVHSKHFNNTRKISTRRTQIETPVILIQPDHVKPQVFVNNDGFMRIGQQYQADLSKIESLDNLSNLKKKLQQQRVWNGSKDHLIYGEIQEQVKEQVYSNINHQDMLIILNSFKNNLPLLQKKLMDQDPLVAHDLLDLKLSVKHKKRIQKIIQ